MSGGVWVGETRHRPPAPTLPLGLVDDVPIDHDPLMPHPEHPTPIDLVVSLSRSEREQRVKELVRMAWNRFDEGVDKLAGGKSVAGTCLLTSGGNDSYTIAHIFRSVATHQVHANTHTGIEATRQFVRDQAAAWEMPLIEVHPDPGAGYFDLVRGTVMARSRETGQMVQAWAGGFPGPAAHKVMYQRLKERGLARVPHILDISGSRADRVLFIAGRRRPESKIRSTVPHYEAKGTTVWLSPLAVWHKADLRAYRSKIAYEAKQLLDSGESTYLGLTEHARQAFFEAYIVPVNPVSRVLGMSGECGCLANGVAGEPERWRAAFPDDPFILEVGAVEGEIADRPDIPDHRKKWGWGGSYDDPDEIERIDGLCGLNCGPDPLADLMDPLFDMDEIGSF